MIAADLIVKLQVEVGQKLLVRRSLRLEVFFARINCQVIGNSLLKHLFNLGFLQNLLFELNLGIFLDVVSVLIHVIGERLVDHLHYDLGRGIVVERVFKLVSACKNFFVVTGPVDFLKLVIEFNHVQELPCLLLRLKL